LQGITVNVDQILETRDPTYLLFHRAALERFDGLSEQAKDGA
jgi:DNA-binding phage protein